MRNEVYNNMDLYYDPTISIQDLSLKMENELKDMQYEYKRLEKVFKKTKL